MTRVCFVTGAAGFIGSHLCRALLARGDRVIGVDNFDPFYDPAIKRANLAALEHERFEFAEGDICDAGAMQTLLAQARPDLLFTIAALAGVRPSIERPDRYLHVNVTGHAVLLEAARAAGCTRVVFASSSSVYGNASRVPFSETDPCLEPISPYAASKRAAELLCETGAHLHGLAIAMLRFFTVYGPSQRPDLAISKFMRLVAEGHEIPMFGDGTTSRDYTYIDDIIDGVLRAADRTETADAGWCRIYNLGGSHPVTLCDMIHAIGEVVGERPVVRRLPMQPGDVERTFADLTRSTEELGYAPQTDFRTGLERQWAWLREQLETSSTPPR